MNEKDLNGGRTNSYMKMMKKQQKDIRRIYNESKKREELLQNELKKAQRIDRETKITDNSYVEKNSDGTTWVDSDDYDTINIHRNDKDTNRFSKTQIHDDDDEPENRTQEKIDGMSIDVMVKLSVILHGVVLEQNNDVYIIQPSSYYTQPELKQNLYCLDKSNKYVKGTNVYFMLEKCNRVLCAIKIIENLEELK